MLPGSAFGSYSLADDIRLIHSQGRGSRLWDVDGREQIDYVGGTGALLLSHSHPAVVAADQAAMRRLDGLLMREGQYVLPGVRRFVSTELDERDLEQTLRGLDAACRALA